MPTFEFPGLDILAREINTHTHSKGHYEEVNTFGDVCALVHSEISEALDEFRDNRGRNEIYFKIIDADLSVGDYDWYYAIGDCIDLETYQQIIAIRPEYLKFLKPMGIPTEFADAIIRLLDEFAEYNVSPTDTIAIKMAYNETRPHRNGRAKL